MWRWFRSTSATTRTSAASAIGTEAGDLHRGWVWRDGEATSVRQQWDVRTSSRPTASRTRSRTCAPPTSAGRCTRCAATSCASAGGARAGRAPHAHQRGARALDLRAAAPATASPSLHQLDADGPSGRAHRVRSATMPEMREITSGLQFPEGPVALADGSVLVVEIKRGHADPRRAGTGSRHLATDRRRGRTPPPSAPTAWSTSDNNGGFEWHNVGGPAVPGNRRTTTRAGAVSSRVRTLPRQGRGPLQRMRRAGAPRPERHRLRASRRLWSPTTARCASATATRTGVFYARADGLAIREGSSSARCANGIGLSPDGRRLTSPRDVDRPRLVLELAGPGEVVAGPGFGPAGGTLLAGCRASSSSTRSPSTAPATSALRPLVTAPSR